MIEIPQKDYEKLKESEERFKSLVKTSPDAVTVSDLEGKITEVSKQTLTLHGYSSEKEIIGKSAFELIAAEDHEKALANLQRTLKEGIITNQEYTLVRKDGSRFIGELNASVIRDSSGQPKAFIATTRDITMRKLAEGDLLESEQLYRTVAEYSPDYIFIVDAQLRIHYVNSSAAQQVGSEADKLIGKAVGDFLPPLLIERAQWDIKRVLESGEAMSAEAMVPFPGHPSWLDVRLIPLKEKSGEARLVLGIARDMTKHKQLEDELMEKMKQLKEFNDLAVGRELKMIELEKEIQRLKSSSK
ncbi:MAG: PAS domain S-box protein [Candidatus Margulisiibacteriota bacterium]